MKYFILPLFVVSVVSCTSTESKPADVEVVRLDAVKSYIGSITGSSDVRILSAGPFERVSDTNDLKECYSEKYIPKVIDFDNPVQPRNPPPLSQIKETFWYSAISVGYKNKLGGDSKAFNVFFVDDSSKIIFVR